MMCWYMFWCIFVCEAVPTPFSTPDPPVFVLVAARFWDRLLFIQKLSGSMCPSNPFLFFCFCSAHIKGVFWLLWQSVERKYMGLKLPSFRLSLRCWFNVWDCGTHVTHRHTQNRNESNRNENNDVEGWGKRRNVWERFLKERRCKGMNKHMILPLFFASCFLLLPSFPFLSLSARRQPLCVPYFLSSHSICLLVHVVGTLLVPLWLGCRFRAESPCICMYESIYFLRHCAIIITVNCFSLCFFFFSPLFSFAYTHGRSWLLLLLTPAVNASAFSYHSIRIHVSASENVGSIAAVQLLKWREIWVVQVNGFRMRQWTFFFLPFRTHRCPCIPFECTTTLLKHFANRL